ncbi:Mu-like prophage major head subunit gpT family protein [Kaustia mangrovi]|uniref:Mu-like prophage major head subunit gpT family protein n=1 Tax=Kaustia mangrovi TaxID=2593653 RepID=A0A7S8C5X4_9HYPH|nr:prohead protease/major capsid protein fusion protein [Kaustia mangrovi]QPC44000.1 Mu-like prophage major head subunit gpT family protein [Kaustia mangrovi]
MSDTATDKKRRQLPPLYRGEVEIRADTADDDERTVEMVWTTGSRVLRRRFFGEDFYEELSLDPKHVRMDRLTSGGAPLLNAHNSWDARDVVGVIEGASLEKKRGICTARFSKREDVGPIFQDVRDGILRNVSVGYRVYKMEQVEGGDGQTPVYRAVDWEPYEVSIVPMGADPGAQMRGTDQTAPNDCEFVTRTEEGDMSKTDDPTKEADKTRANPAETPATPETVDLNAVRNEASRDALKKERQRIADLEKIARAAKIDDETLRSWKESDITADEARTAALDHLHEKSEEVQTQSQRADASVMEDEREKWIRGVEDSIITRAGLTGLITDAAKARGETVKLDAGEFRGMTLSEIARDCLERAGVKTRGMDRQKMVGLSFTHRSSITQSTSDFGVALENVMHKTLQAAYATQPDTWTRFCKRGQVSDFRPHNKYRMGMFGRLDKVMENGEFKNKKIRDAEKELISAGTVGNVINLSRQTIINDDMGVFNDLAAMLGRAARLSVEVDVYGLLAENAGAGPTMSDGKALFHADHGNISTTAGAPSVATFEAARVQMGKLKDPWGAEYIDLRPAIWLGPLSLGGQARVVNDAQYDVDVVNKLQVPNKVRGLFSDIVDTPRLDGNPWYLFADPGTAPVIEVVFLDGIEEPFLDMMDGWRVDGVEWKVRLDYGVGARDWRGVQKNPGA